MIRTTSVIRTLESVNGPYSTLRHTSRQQRASASNQFNSTPQSVQQSVSQQTADPNTNGFSEYLMLQSDPNERVRRILLPVGVPPVPLSPPIVSPVSDTPSAMLPLTERQIEVCKWSGHVPTLTHSTRVSWPPEVGSFKLLWHILGRQWLRIEQPQQSPDYHIDRVNYNSWRRLFTHPNFLLWLLTWRQYWYWDTYMYVNLHTRIYELLTY